MKIKNIKDYDYFSMSHDYVGIKIFEQTSAWPDIRKFIDLQSRFDTIYGYEKITEVVTTELSERFYKALKKFRQVVDYDVNKSHLRDKEHLNLICMRSEICQRGLMALDQYARDNNLMPLPRVWTVYSNDKKIGIAKTVDEFRSAQILYDDFDLMFTLNEIGLILNEFKSIVDIKESLRKKNKIQAKVVEIKEPKKQITQGDEFDDEIPF